MIVTNPADNFKALNLYSVAVVGNYCYIIDFLLLIGLIQIILNLMH